jgi:hypothetical protein
LAFGPVFELSRADIGVDGERENNRLKIQRQRLAFVCLNRYLFFCCMVSNERACDAVSARLKIIKDKNAFACWYGALLSFRLRIIERFHKKIGARVGRHRQ